MVQGPSARRVFRRRCASTACESRRDPRSRLNSPRLRAAQFCSVRVMVIRPSRPSVDSARKKEGRTPRAFNQIGTRPPGRWGNARRSTAPAPQSKPVTHATRLVAHVAPLVGIRTWAENSGRRASSSMTLLLLRALCEQDLKSLLGLVRARGHRLIPSQRPARLPRSLPAAESSTETATLGDRMKNWAIRSLAIEPISPRCCSRAPVAPRCARRHP